MENLQNHFWTGCQFIPSDKDSINCTQSCLLHLYYQPFYYHHYHSFYYHTFDQGYITNFVCFNFVCLYPHEDSRQNAHSGSYLSFCSLDICAQLIGLHQSHLNMPAAHLFPLHSLTAMPCFQQLQAVFTLLYVNNKTFVCNHSVLPVISNECESCTQLTNEITVHYYEITATDKIFPFGRYNGKTEGEMITLRSSSRKDTL